MYSPLSWPIFTSDKVTVFGTGYAQSIVATKKSEDYTAMIIRIYCFYLYQLNGLTACFL